MDYKSLLVNSGITPGQFADILQNLSEILRSSGNPSKGKGYFLSKVPSKKSGFIYYARYYDRGIVVPSRWSTGTNDPVIANSFAIRNRQHLLDTYYHELETGKEKSLYSVLRNYYKEGSKYLETERNRGRHLSSHTAGSYHHFIIKKIIPFLRRNGIKDFTQITPPIIVKLQNSLLKIINPQTVNYYISCVKRIFDYLVLHGELNENILVKVPSLIIPDEKKGNTGCYDIDIVKGVFNKKWPDKKLFMLCLLIYTTNMRNCEIEKIKLSDIFKIGSINFLRVQGTKTKNAPRIIPLHPFVYRNIVSFAKDTHDFIFSKNGKPNQSTLYLKATTMMCAMIGETIDYMKKEHISFYSGRTYWKTLMNADGLGDIEEYFMGHKVSSDVSKRYNHKDKNGKAMIIKKAIMMFDILDRGLFS